MNVVGIDPSLTATGIAHVDGDLSTVRGADGDERLDAIYQAVYAACYGSPDLAVIEDLPTHAHGAGKTGMAQGVVRYALRYSGTPYVVVAPATLKKFATGTGNAGKADMRMALYRRTGRDVRDDNQVDAAWLRELGLHLLGKPSVDLPKTHTTALAKVAMPDADRGVTGGTVSHGRQG